MTRWLVTGAEGQMGTDLMQALQGEKVIGWGHKDLDLTDGYAVRRALHAAAPDVVLNAAGYTDVDGAETDPEAAGAVNMRGPGVLAAACGEYGTILVHPSTDYVFAGDATRPYKVSDTVGPQSTYARTKEAGEVGVRSAMRKHYIVRTSWLYGAGGDNFVKTMARLERERDTVKVVDDQHGSPTWAAELVERLLELATSGVPWGTYHCTGGGATTWYGLARAVFEELGADPDRVKPCSTAEMPRPAHRPAYSVLSNESWETVGLTPMSPWREALAMAFAKSGDALRAG